MKTNNKNKAQHTFNFFEDSQEEYIKNSIRNFISQGRISKSNAVNILEEIRAYSKRHKNKQDIGNKFYELIEQYSL